MPSRLRVRAGWLAGALVLALARPSWNSILLGLLFAIPGEALRIWASGHIEKTRTLATGGPYAFTRNPLYLGSLLITLGVVLASRSVWAALVVAAYGGAFYPSVVREEAGYLRQNFSEYDAWAAKVPLFLPSPVPGGPRATHFSWARVTRNREWMAALAVPGIVLLLCLRCWLS